MIAKALSRTVTWCPFREVKLTLFCANIEGQYLATAWGYTGKPGKPKEYLGEDGPFNTAKDAMAVAHREMKRLTSRYAQKGLEGISLVVNGKEEEYVALR